MTTAKVVSTDCGSPCGAEILTVHDPVGIVTRKAPVQLVNSKPFPHKLTLEFPRILAVTPETCLGGAGWSESFTHTENV